MPKQFLYCSKKIFVQKQLVFSLYKKPQLKLVLYFKKMLLFLSKTQLGFSLIKTPSFFLSYEIAGLISFFKNFFPNPVQNVCAFGNFINVNMFILFILRKFLIYQLINIVHTLKTISLVI